MTFESLLAKAEQAEKSSAVLFGNDDFDGACNRAYYAMFTAAQASLVASGASIGKTHRGTLNAFNLHLVKEGIFPSEMGRMLKRVEAYRYTADYDADSVIEEDAREAIQMTTTFIEAVKDHFKPGNNGPK